MCGEQAQRRLLVNWTVAPTASFGSQLFPSGAGALESSCCTQFSNSITADRGAGCSGTSEASHPILLSACHLCWFVLGSHPGPQERLVSRRQEKKGWEKSTLYCYERDGRGTKQGL